MALIAATRAEGGLVFCLDTGNKYLLDTVRDGQTYSKIYSKIARDRLSWLEEVREFV